MQEEGTHPVEKFPMPGATFQQSERIGADLVARKSLSRCTQEVLNVTTFSNPLREDKGHSPLTALGIGEELAWGCVEDSSG